tara:strand:+ start:2057 stop:3022 length:966 start_codon:yes stop_codon:yes gene_type:complete
MDPNRDTFKMMREGVAKKLLPEKEEVSTQEEALEEFFTPSERAKRSLKDAAQPLLDMLPFSLATEGGARAAGAASAGKEAVEGLADKVNTARLQHSRDDMLRGQKQRSMDIAQQKLNEFKNMSEETRQRMGRRKITPGMADKAQRRVEELSEWFIKNPKQAAQPFNQSKVALGIMGNALKRGASLVDTLGLLGTLPVQAALYPSVLAAYEAGEAASVPRQLTLMADSKSKVNEKASPLEDTDLANPGMMIAWFRNNPDEAKELYTAGVLSEKLYRDAMASEGQWEGRLRLEVDDLLKEVEDDTPIYSDEQIASLQPERSRN